MSGHMYFIKADEFHLPMSAILLLGVPCPAKSDALPILNEWVLNWLGSLPILVKSADNVDAMKFLVKGAPD